MTVLISVNLVAGFMIVSHYGESWDEATLFKYAERSLRAYNGIFESSQRPVSFQQVDPLHGDHGPAFVMLVTLVRNGILHFTATLPSVVIDHFLYFLTFQIGVISLYSICQRWMSSQAAFGAALLFSTQPLLWGHSFINPKDAPFMSLFLASVALGMRMVDRSKVETINTYREMTRKDIPTLTKKRYLIVSIIWLTLLTILWIWGADLIQSLILSAYSHDNTVLGQIFQNIAQQAQHVSLNQYIQKGMILWNRIRIIVSLFSMFFVGKAFWECLPQHSYHIFHSVKSFGKNGLLSLLEIDVWLAALMLGFAAAVRLIAPIAGFLIILYALLNRKWQMFPKLISYAILSFLIMTALWPYLWPAPLERFALSVLNSSNYPIDIQTLFRGDLYFSSQIPPSYLPTLIVFQLTETTLGLALFGTVLLARRKEMLNLMVIVVLWFLFPFLGFIFLHTPLYDNFRHILFILPPLFILTGIGLDWLLKQKTLQPYRHFILIVSVIPALIADINLHPYQYVYYNSLAGGMRGAYRSYQLDYWDISYREAALFLNQIAPQNANVAVVGPYQVVLPYLRSDLKAIDTFSAQNDWNKYDFIIVGTRNDEDFAFSQYRTIYTIERMGAVLAVIKQP
jgi:hypothetical protein